MKRQNNLLRSRPFYWNIDLLPCQHLRHQIKVKDCNRVAEGIKREFWYQHALAKLYTNRRSKCCCTCLSKRPIDCNRALEGFQHECMQLIYNTDVLVCFQWFMLEGYSDVALIPTSQPWYQSCHQIDKKKEEDAWQWDSEHDKMVGWIQSCLLTHTQQIHTTL